LSTPWRAAAAGLDLATAACAALNLAYFCHRLALVGDQTSHRVAALALALVSLGAVAESLFFLISFAGAGPPASLPWTLVRALPFAGTAFISVLILRRIANP